MHSEAHEVAVLVAPGQGDLAMVVTALERHADKLVIQVTVRKAVMKVVPIDPPGEAGIELWDDVGTAYQRSGGSSGGDESVDRVAVFFRPAVPGAASRLGVRTPVGEVVFDL